MLQEFSKSTTIANWYILAIIHQTFQAVGVFSNVMHPLSTILKTLIMLTMIGLEHFDDDRVVLLVPSYPMTSW